jgi:hypothetical protein
MAMNCCAEKMHIICWVSGGKNTHTRTIFTNYCFSSARMVTQTPLNIMSYVNRLSCFLSFQGALIPSIINTSKYTKNTILLQTELSVPSNRRVLFSGPLMVSNQHSDAGCRITGVASLSTFLLFLSSKPDYSWEIKEQIFKWCHTHRPLLSLPRFLPPFPAVSCTRARFKRPTPHLK